MNGAFKCNTFTQNAARNCNAQRSLRLVSCRVQAATLQHPSVSAGSQVQQQFGSPAPQAGATSFNLDWTFPLLTPEECKALLQSPKTCVVLDVRNKDEFEAGYLLKAVNVLADEVEAGGPQLDSFIREHALDADVIIVHCMFSIKRGPRGAKALQKKLKQLRAFRNQVYLLTGGIAAFMDHYSNDSSLVWLPDPEHGWKPVPH